MASSASRLREEKEPDQGYILPGFEKGLPPMFLDPASSELFEKGKPGQGYVWLAWKDTESKEDRLKIALVPSYNEGDENVGIDKNNEEFPYFVKSSAARGGTTGVVHNMAFRELTKLGIMKYFTNRKHVFAGGLFKGEKIGLFNTETKQFDSPQLFLDFMNKSGSFNTTSVEYPRELILCLFYGMFEGEDRSDPELEADKEFIVDAKDPPKLVKNPFFEVYNDFYIKRELPREVTHSIRDFLLKNLPCPPTVKREAANTTEQHAALSWWFQNRNNPAAKNTKLMHSLFISAKKGKVDLCQEILSHIKKNVAEMYPDNPQKQGEELRRLLNITYGEKQNTVLTIASASLCVWILTDLVGAGASMGSRNAENKSVLQTIFATINVDQATNATYIVMRELTNLITLALESKEEAELSWQKIDNIFDDFDHSAQHESMALMKQFFSNMFFLDRARFNALIDHSRKSGKKAIFNLIRELNIEDYLPENSMKLLISMLVQKTEPGHQQNAAGIFLSQVIMPTDQATLATIKELLTNLRQANLSDLQIGVRFEKIVYNSQSYRTLLQAMIDKNFLESAKLLLSLPVPIRWEDIHMAITTKNQEMLSLLLEGMKAQRLDIHDGTFRYLVREAEAAGPPIFNRVLESYLNFVSAKAADEKEIVPSDIQLQWLEVASKATSLQGFMDHQYADKQTMLHMAASLGSTHWVTQLLEFNADVLRMDSRNQTPFSLAAHGGNAKIENLLQENISSKLRDAVRSKDPTFIQKLAAVSDKEGTIGKLINSTSGLSLSSLFHETVKRNQVDCVKAFLLAGADGNALALNQTPAHIAVSLGLENELAMTKTLVRFPIDFYKPDNNGWSAIDYAMRNHQWDLLTIVFAHQSVKETPKLSGDQLRSIHEKSDWFIHNFIDYANEIVDPEERRNLVRNVVDRKCELGVLLANTASPGFFDAKAETSPALQKIMAAFSDLLTSKPSTPSPGPER